MAPASLRRPPLLPIPPARFAGTLAPQMTSLQHDPPVCALPRTQPCRPRPCSTRAPHRRSRRPRCPRRPTPRRCPGTRARRGNSRCSSRARCSSRSSSCRRCSTGCTRGGIPTPRTAPGSGCCWATACSRAPCTCSSPRSSCTSRCARTGWGWWGSTPCSPTGFAGSGRSSGQSRATSTRSASRRSRASSRGWTTSRA